MEKKYDYKKSGVNIDAADQAVDKIKNLADSTMRPEVIGNIGDFGGLFALENQNYSQPVLVAGTDGVGTKLKLATAMQKHDTVGKDCVAMCVNDILVQGAEPLFFMDYLAVGELDDSQVSEIVSGVASGCREAGCALLGGETAEMPGFYPPGEYDLAGFAVGVVERGKIIEGVNINEGDIVMGLASSGIHSNGFSLVRKIIEGNNLSLNHELPGRAEENEAKGQPLGLELLKPTEVYVPVVLPLLEKFEIKGMSHITGGGLPGNLSRILPSSLGIELEPENWELPYIFKYIQKEGNVDWKEMYRVFNMGIGFALVVSRDDASEVQNQLQKNNTRAWVIGEVITGLSDKVVIKGV